ncbi:MAG: hypothetical protein KBD27_02060 [Candidatus Moranbacteria bacterium]|nr:hypothetical protein [Candidatus Moranbacteria bacterium]
MFLQKFSKIGSAFVVVYFCLFIYALAEAITTCPSFFCNLGLQIATFPWSLLFEPQYNIFDLPKFYGAASYVVSTLFFLCNSFILYSFGKFLGFLALRLRGESSL